MEPTSAGLVVQLLESSGAALIHLLESLKILSADVQALIRVSIYSPIVDATTFVSPRKNPIDNCSIVKFP